MMLLNTSLLRERFIISDEKTDKEAFVAKGNRILLPLTTRNGEFSEKFVVRARSMHMALRMAAEITDSFFRIGPLMHRMKPFPWKQTWYDISGEFERPHYTESWICVYHKGRPIYKDGNYHPFLDVIEQCDIKNRAEYDKAIPIAKDLFQQSGKAMAIDHRVNIAAVIGTSETQSRCGLILRGATNTSTFNFSIKPKMGTDQKTIPVKTGLDITAAFLEGIELAFKVGRLKRNTGNAVENGQFETAAYNRIGRLNRFIEDKESFYDIFYRPEKPDLIHLMRQSQNIHV